MFRRPRSSQQQGFSLIETLVALLIVLLALVLVLPLLWQQPRVLARLESQKRAARTLEATLETIRAGGVLLRDGEIEWLVAPPPGAADMQLVLDVESTDIEGLYDIRVEARYHEEHRGVVRSLATRVWRP